MNPVKAWAVLDSDPSNDYQPIDMLSMVAAGEYQIFDTYREAISVSRNGRHGVIRVEIREVKRKRPVTQTKEPR